MKLGHATESPREVKQRQKFLMMSCRQIVTQLSFFQFMANLAQSGSRILDAQSADLLFSIRAIFYLTKTENRTKNL